MIRFLIVVITVWLFLLWLVIQANHGLVLNPVIDLFKVDTNRIYLAHNPPIKLPKFSYEDATKIANSLRR